MACQSTQSAAQHRFHGETAQSLPPYVGVYTVKYCLFFMPGMSLELQHAEAGQLVEDEDAAFTRASVDRNVYVSVSVRAYTWLPRNL